jgi:hypothetical protein
MSGSEDRLPPAADEVHLPGPSTQPFLLAVGITVALVGVTFHWWLLVAGLLLTVWQLVSWIRDCRREVNELPLEH